MERRDRAPVGTFHSPGPWSRAQSVELGDAAAHHALVKRLTLGDAVRLTNGSGSCALGSIVELSKRRFVVALHDAPEEAIRALPRIELLVPVGDRERMLWLAEKAVELGVSAWRPIAYARSRSVSPRGEGAAFAEKVRLRMISALEQCGGAWLPELHPQGSIADVTGEGNAAGAATSILLDADGESVGDILSSMDPPIRVALGPEGGLDEAERADFIRAGWRLVSLGANVLRFETAGIAALAILRSHPRERP